MRRHASFTSSILALSALSLTACVIDVDPGAIDDEAIGSAGAALTSFTLSIAATTDDALSRSFTVDASSSVPVHLLCVESGGTEIHRAALGQGTHFVVTLRGFKPATPYECQAIVTGFGSGATNVASFATASLPPTLVLPAITVPSADRAATGYTMFNTGTQSATGSYTNQAFVILDAEGHVRWFHQALGAATPPGAPDHDIGYLGRSAGSVLFGGGWPQSNLHVPPTIMTLGHAATFTSGWSASVSGEISGSYNHDAGKSARTDKSTIFTIVDQTPTTTTLCRYNAIKEIDTAIADPTAQVAWTWNPRGPEGKINGVYALPSCSQQVNDPNHMNAVFDRYEGTALKVYASFKNASRVLKIDHATRSIEWVLGRGGSFTLLDEGGAAYPDQATAPWFENQHDAKMVGDLMVLHDNGPSNGSRPTRALVLRIDEANRTAQIVRQWTESGWYEPIWGGVDALGDHLLIAKAHSYAVHRQLGESDAAQDTSAITEVDGSGAVVWRAEFASPQSMIYRAERIGGCDIFNNRDYCAIF